MFQFIYSKLTFPLANPYIWNDSKVTTAISRINDSPLAKPYIWDDSEVPTVIRCINESKEKGVPQQAVSPFSLAMRGTQLPYDCLCLSHVLSCYPVLALEMSGCHIGDKGAELLVKHYPCKNLTGQLLEELNLRKNDLTSKGMEHVMKIVRTSEPHY